MPNQSIELHDSQLAVLWYEQNGEAILIFSALYIHQSEGQPGIDLGTGWFQRAEMVIEDASLTEFIREWPCLIYGGGGEMDGAIFSNCAPLPLMCKSSFRILLEALDNSGNGSHRRIEITGSSVGLTLLGKPGHVEKFPGTG